MQELPTASCRTTFTSLSKGNRNPQTSNASSRAKQYSGFYYAQQFRERLWQRYGFERVLRESEPTSVVARYILENPVRAGLVSRIEDYPFLGSFEYTLSQLIEYAYAENAAAPPWPA